MNKKLVYILLLVIVVFALVLRVIKLGSNPAAITWDEAAVGYNAYTIWNWGMDEWGNKLPLVFKSFGDDKNPIHIYFTVPFVAILGLTEFATRLSASLMGVLNVLAIFFVGKALFKNKWIGLTAAFFLAVSPYNLQFSRFSHELNFAIFFFLAGIIFFYKGIEKKKIYLLPAFLFWGVDLLTYHSAKIVTPLLILILIGINLKKLLKVKSYFLWGGVVYIFFISLLFIKPELLGGARLRQNAMTPREIENTVLFQKTQSKLLGIGEIVGQRYVEYFKPKFLFISGDENPRHSIQTMGTFYWLDLPFLIIGFISLFYLLFKKRKMEVIFLLAWILLAPLPGAASSITPHAPRAMFLTGSVALVCSLGVYQVISIFKNRYLKIAFALIVVLAYGFFLSQFLREYFGNYRSQYAIEWRYGMKEAVEASQEYVYDNVYVTSSFMQPYIFFLYYLKTPLPQYLESVRLNKTESAPSSIVASFGKYHFIWNELNSEPLVWNIYVVRPSVYDGLVHKASFEVTKLIKYPGGEAALYAVRGK